MSHVNNKGFTLIELMLAMSFIAVLLLAIAMTVIQISNIYNRGLTLKDVNQAGRSLTNELQRSIAISPPFAIDYPASDSKYINTPTGGRLCVGQYSYIWNYGKSLLDNTANNKYFGESIATIRFVKVPDSSGGYCTAPNSPIVVAGAVELLDVGDLSLAIHGFHITTESTASDSNTKQSLYYISFIIGTNEAAALNANTTCKPPGSAGSNENYCSVNQFDIVVRTGNAVQ